MGVDGGPLEERGGLGSAPAEAGVHAGMPRFQGGARPVAAGGAFQVAGRPLASGSTPDGVGAWASAGRRPPPSGPFAACASSAASELSRQGGRPVAGGMDGPPAASGPVSAGSAPSAASGPPASAAASCAGAEAPPAGDGPHIWAGRLGEAGGRQALGFTASIGFDHRLFREDIAGSRAHARMLGRAGLLSGPEVEALLAGLDRVEAEFEAGTFPIRPEHEDIHLNIERRLGELLGPVAGKLHTARSRNDQVALDMHLWVKAACAQVVGGIRRLQAALVMQAEAAGDALAPGFTHLQHAQPVLFAHHLLAYFFMLERDCARLRDCADRADRSPLGAAALAGTAHPIDPVSVAAELGMAGIYANSMDAVSDRDFTLELLAALSILMVHTSRLGEEIVLWSSREFGFVEPADAYATGSSIMPQKKNPDVAELARGKSGRVFGHLLGLLTVMKGLPLAYHSDMQEDKEACFDAVDTALAVTAALAGLVGTLRLRPERMAAALVGDFSGATDVADALVGHGVPFREAHGVVGALVRRCVAAGCEPATLPAAELAALHPALTPELVGVMAPRTVVAARRSPGGTAPERVAEALALARRLLAAAD